jgi:hypothetical protein
MAAMYRRLIGLCWGVGLLMTVAALVVRLVPVLEQRSNPSPRGLLILAGVLFLCALATGEMERGPSPKS